MPFDLTLGEILRTCRPTYYTRGKEYFANDKVKQLEWDHETQTLFSVVGGSGRNKYSQEIIFDRFKQLEAGATKGHRGHGLGLSICWSLAELLDGTLDLDSQPSKGSRFVLTLPRPDVEVVMHATDSNFFLFDENDGEVESF